MTQLIAVIHQSGGCDYLIECGTKVMYQKKDQTDNDFVKEVMDSYSAYAVQFYTVEPKRIQHEKRYFIE